MFKPAGGRRSATTKRSGPSSSSAAAPAASAARRIPAGGAKCSASPPTTVDVDGTPVHFPFRPYDCQVDYMKATMAALNRGENALLESPTGTGKTLCLLCSTLAWQRGRAALFQSARGASQMSQQAKPIADADANAGPDDDAPAAPRRSVILYASRTHSQLTQVVGEMRATRYRPKHAILGSREQLCVHPRVKTKGATSADINAGCSKLSKERKCRFKNNLEGFTVPNNEPGAGGRDGGGCGSGGGSSSSAHQPILDLEELQTLGTERKVCPFYLTRGNVKEAEIIFLPYNYLLDPDIRTGTLAEVNLAESVIIFDEAHNLESFASESASFDISGVDIAGCVNEVSRAIAYHQAVSSGGAEADGGISLDNLVRLKALLLRFERYIDSELPAGGGSYAGEYIFHVLREGMNLTPSTWEKLVKMIRHTSDFILDARGGGGGSGAASGATPKLDYLVSSVKKVFAGADHLQAMARAGGYRVNVTARSGAGTAGRTLSYWCLTPSLALIELKALQVRSILVTSGTLSPLPSYAMELGLPFPHRLENPHIITSRQIHVQILAKGLGGKSLCSNFSRRNDPEYVAELGNTLASLARVVPGGMLVFFPSYGVMNSCVAGWGGPSRDSKWGGSGGGANNKGFFAPRRRGSKAGSSNSERFSFPHAPDYYGADGANKSPWSRLLTAKAIVLEPRSSALLNTAIGEYKKFIDKPKSSGAILLGVCRGKISEGIDFAGNLCRAVVITGLPFPPYKDDKVRLKREYLDSIKAGLAIKSRGDGGFDTSQNNSDAAKQPQSLSGAEWYDQQAHRAVNQAVGRTIRNRNDWGAILLLDSRFSEVRNRKGLSKWVRPYVTDDQGIGKNIGRLVRFYKGVQILEEERAAGSAGTAGKLSLKYEDGGDNQEEQVAKEEVTRITIVSKPTATKDKTIDAADEGMMHGYVHPDLVLTRMDMKDKQNGGRSSRPPWDGALIGSASIRSSKSNARGLASLYEGSTKQKSSSSFSIAASGKQASNPQLGWDKIENSGAIDGHGIGLKCKIPPRNMSGSSSAPAPPKGNGARQFFERARTSLSTDEFRSIRKLLVRMKQHGDKKDEDGYLRATEELLEILVRYDYAKKRSTGKCLLDLLCPLLPAKMLPAVKSRASVMIFEASSLNRKCKQSLSSEDYQIVASSVVPLLKTSIGCGENKNSFLRDAGDVLKILKKYLAQVPVASFIEIIPTRHVQSVHALADYITKADMKVKSKNAERKRLGEASIRMENFRRPVPIRDPTKIKLEEAEDPEQLEAQNDMEGALMAAQQVRNKMKQKIREQIMAKGLSKTSDSSKKSTPIRIPGNHRSVSTSVRNPYAKMSATLLSSKDTSTAVAKSKAGASKKISVPEPTVGDEGHRSSKRAKSMLTQSRRSVKPDLKTGLQNKASSPSAFEKKDAIDKCLEQVNGDVFCKSSRRPLAKVRNNIPRGLECRLCNELMKDPLVSDCHHSACSMCWSKWLEKHETCPICRQEISMQRLSKMIFASTQGEVPTLSQVMRCDGEDSESSSDGEDELVIVK